MVKKSQKKNRSREKRTAKELNKIGKRVIRLEVDKTPLAVIANIANDLPGIGRLSERQMHVALFEKLGSHPRVKELMSEILLWE